MTQLTQRDLEVLILVCEDPEDDGEYPCIKIGEIESVCQKLLKMYRNEMDLSA